MLNEIAFGAKDQKLVDKYYEEKNAKDPEDNKRYMIITIQIRLNGAKAVDADFRLNVPEDQRINYTMLKGILMHFFSRNVEDKSIDTNLDTDINVDQPEDEFWKIIHEDHLHEDGNKIPDDVNKHDIDVSVFVNGALVYHGWQLVGTHGGLKLRDLLELSSITVKTGMSDSETEPTEEEIKSLPW